MKNERTRALATRRRSWRNALRRAGALRLRATVPRRVRRPVRAGLDAREGSTTTRERRSSSSPRRSASRSAAAGATTTSSRSLGGPSTPGIGFGAGIERLVLTLRKPARFRSRPGGPLLPRRSRRRPRCRPCRDDAASRGRARLRHRLRGALAEGPADAARAVGARGFVHVRRDGVTVKRYRDALEQEVALADVVATVLA